MDDQSHINGTLPSEPTDKADAGNHGNKELTAEEEKEETGCEKKRTKQPFMYCSLIVRRPKLMFGKFYFSKSLYCHPTLSLTPLTLVYVIKGSFMDSIQVFSLLCLFY